MRRNASPTHPAFRSHILDLLDRVEPRLDELVRPGDRVFLKPFLRHGRQSDPTSRLTSHPVLVETLIEALADCGAKISVGDEGSRHMRAEADGANAWLHAVARRTGATPVNFLKAGARVVRGPGWPGRGYPLTRALLDSDRIVGCANLQRHAVLGLSGAIKNMFNAVVGDRQGALHRRNRRPRDLARVVVDVFSLVEPDLSILDATSVRHGVGSDPGDFATVGWLLAGADAVALDATAARLVGREPHDIDTIRIAARRGLGILDEARIDLIGADGGLPTPVPIPCPAPHEMQPLGWYERFTSFVTDSVLRAKPVIDEVLCRRCGECAQFCPTGAISAPADLVPSVAHARCIQCKACVTACTEGAVSMAHGDAARIARLAAHALVRSKSGNPTTTPAMTKQEARTR